jgi:3-hydroxymyristoyl/3-hydroxydecanoyl-(acyl carrier protein) dehydratase
MNQLLPRVLAARPRDENSPPRHIVLDLHVPPELAHFAGHFPGLPILPGVVQLDWAVRFAREHLAVTGEFTRVENLKFLALVLPDARLQLELRLDAAGDRFEFSFAGAERKYSSGRVLFGAHHAPAGAA